ncbi:MAG: hypothetical protein C4530_06370 [Desulfobacteraceae bacterium]|nr:MAG: hypothetical protein C4530_06370 [Desulfobacteraceae bacterium]
MEESNIREIAFFGRITAGVTHELKNVLAIIGESSGLMEDLIQISKESSFPHAERMHRAIETIREQIQRGVEITTRLNRFAHDPDHAVRSIGLNETLENLAALTNRFARLKNVALAVQKSEEAITIESRPVMLQMVLFICIEYGLDILTAGGRIDIQPAVEDGNSRIRFRFTDTAAEPAAMTAAAPGEEKWTMLAPLLFELGATAERDHAPGSMVLHLPRTIPSRGAVEENR